MRHYEEKPEDLLQDTKDFLKSDLGKYIMETLEEKAKGHLSGASDINAKYPERYAAKYSALKEVIEFIKSPIG